MKTFTLNLPNKITLARIALIPLFTVVFFLDSYIPYAKFISAMIFMLAAVTDFLDGFIARKNNQVTTLGKFLDPIADKLVVTIAMLLILFADPYHEYLIYIVICTMLVIARELIISTFRTVAAVNNTIMAADKWGKAKTVAQFAALPILMCTDELAVFLGLEFTMMFFIGLALLIFSTVLAIFSAFNYIIKNAAVLFDKKVNEEGK